MRNLCPRYSLLTLLILTALVAGGVKLWYGPHRVAISEPQSAFEQEVLARAQWSEYLWKDVCDFQYLYLNGGAAPELLGVVGILREEYKLYIGEQSHAHCDSLGAFLYDPTKMRFQSHGKYHAVNILRVVYAGQSLRQAPTWLNTVYDGTSEIKDCYLLTADAEVYQLLYMGSLVGLKSMTMSDIVDPVAREILTLEVARLPRGEK